MLSPIAGHEHEATVGGLSEENTHAAIDETDEFAQRLLIIEREASSLLEKLAGEFSSVKDKILLKADNDLQRAQDAIETNRDQAVAALERDYLDKRNSINDAAHAQLQLVYTIARAEDQTRKAMLKGPPLHAFRTQKNMNYISGMKSPVLTNPIDIPPINLRTFSLPQISGYQPASAPFLSPFHSTLNLPVIYTKPYDTPPIPSPLGGIFGPPTMQKSSNAT